MKIQESAENYLEVILMLTERNGTVRSIDIVNETGFTKPSISVAMKRLRENGCVEMDSQGSLTLTSRGREIAERVYTRHRTLTKCLTALGVNPETAREDACRIEHVISQETFDRLAEHLTKRGRIDEHS